MHLKQAQQLVSNVMLNRYNMKIRIHNSTAETSCEEKEQKITTRALRKKALKDPNPKEKENRPRKENLCIKVQKEPKQDNKLTVQSIRVKSKDHALKGEPTQEYEEEILAYIKAREGDFRVQPQMLRNQQNYTPKNRRAKVKYFFKMAQKYKLKRSTIGLAVYYMDAYVQQAASLEKMELIYIAQAALFIAMKYEEIYPPELREWTSHYREVIEAEAQILISLNFKLSHFTCEHFVDYYLSKINPPDATTKMIHQIVDTSYFDETMYKEKPSDLARSIVLSVVCPERVEERMTMGIKWMLERCEQHLSWLQQNCKY